LNNLYPLTHPQKRIWYVEKTFPGTGVSNIASTVRIKEKIDFESLNKAINHVVKTNEAMRTRIIEQGSTPLQYFAPYHPFEIDFYDFTGKPLDELYKWDIKLSHLPLRFIDSDLFYFAMFKLNDSDGGFFCNLHHIITDAWTEMLLYSQIMTAYRAFCEGKSPEFSPAPSYTEYIAREQKYLESDRFNSDRNYWVEQFTPLPDLVTLQTKKPSKKSLAAHRKAFLLSYEEAEQIRKFCAEMGITVFSFFLSLLTVYIYRITGADDIVLGTPVLNRLNAREKSIFGMFISTVPLRFNIDQTAKYIDYARGINANWLSILRHQQYPYDLLQREIRKNNGNIENLYEITLSYQNAKTPKDVLLWDGSTRWHFSGYQNEPLVIHINDRDDDGTLILNYDYNISCFADREIDFIHSHFKCLIKDTLQSPDKPICALNLIGSEELKRIQGFNETTDDRDRSLTVTTILQKQTDLTPDAEALVFHDRSLTFAQLDTASNRIANHLRKTGIKPNDIIGVMLPRSIELIVSILGIVKSGGAFLLIDPYYPEDRIKYMLENSRSKYLLTTPVLTSRYSLDQELVIFPDDPQISGESSQRPLPVNKPNDLLYVFYTSGSTGMPKGVMIEHYSLCAFINAVSKFMYYRAGEALLSLCTVAFDIFIFEVFPALSNGMKVVLADENEQRMPSLQKELIKKHKIVKFMGTPVRMQLLLDDPGSRECFTYLREVMLGGDVFPEQLLKRMKETMSAEIFNGYGPTETTIGVTFKNLTKTNEINIGRPIANTRIYILDRHKNIVPIGVPGEIYIGGEGLARGYLNNPELTAERFVPNPFVPGERLYRTGDLGRWYPKGEIAFLGRIDSQVKIRGYRIELGEIENVIRQFPGVANVVVLDIEDRGKKSLCAYLVQENGSSLDIKTLRNFLFKRLPGFMVPSFYLSVDAIPYNSNGKIDRRALPVPDNLQMLRRDYEPPSNPVEIKLCSIWETVLGIKEISPYEDFFDLGGDSLDVVSLAASIHAQFGIHMTISDLYDASILRKQAQKIEELNLLTTGATTARRNVVPLRQGAAAKNLFLAHAGNGEINNYYQLSLLLRNEINYYGLRYLTDGIAPQNLTIPGLASLYLKQIMDIQPHGPYRLGGWCIGGTIAYETARQLEERGEEVALLLLINSICPRPWNDIAKFDINTERAFFSSYLAGLVQKTGGKAMDGDSVNDIWDNAVLYLRQEKMSEHIIRANIPEEVSGAIPDFCTADALTLIKYINIIRTLHNARAFYFPSGALKARVSFIEASANDVIPDKAGNLAGWQRYCSRSIRRISVEGDHFSIFTSPHIDALSQALNTLLIEI